MARPISRPALAALVLLAGCGGGGSGSSAPTPTAPAGLRLTSPAFTDGGTIPRRFTCSGGGAAPPLRWSRPPGSTRAFALSVEDPDAPAGGFVHWILFDVPARTRSLAGATPPPGAHQAKNGTGGTGWTPPCPPPGDSPHRYVFTLSALRAPLGLPDGVDASRADAALARAALAQGRLTGRFGR